MKPLRTRPCWRVRRSRATRECCIGPAYNIVADTVATSFRRGIIYLAPETDLLGGPILRRSAFFPAEDLRERISRDWGPGPRAFVLGCNPSSAGAEKDDPTSLWWNAWFRWFGFGGYDAGNLYPFVSSSPAECRRRYEEAIGGPNWHDRDALFANVDAVVRMAKRSDQVFVCFGNIAWDQDWTEHILEEVQTGVEPWPNLWSWGTTKSGAPTHPMARGLHRIPKDQKPILWKRA